MAGAGFEPKQAPSSYSWHPLNFHLFCLNAQGIVLLPQNSQEQMLLNCSQIGFMNNGKIKAADIQLYINGGCTPDDSELVSDLCLGDRRLDDA